MLMMLPFEAPTIFEGIHKSYFRMPRVVKDQRSKFENDDLFRQLSHESAVKYTGFKDRPLEERQMKFIANCQEGHTEVSVVQSGNQFTLMFNPTANPAYNNEGCDFDKELGKVHIKSGFILNGVCVLWRGWIDLQRLEGFGCLEFDEYRAYLEDAMLKQQIDKQQTCNSSAAAAAAAAAAASNHHQLARLNHLAPLPHPLPHPHGHSHLSGPAHLAAAAAAAAVATNNSLPPVGLNPSCLTGPPPGSLAPNQQQQQQQQAIAGVTQTPVSLADSAAHYGNAAIAAAAAAAFHQALGVGPPQAPILGMGQHLNYTNGTTNQANLIPTSNSRTSPPQINGLDHLNGRISQSTTPTSRSPIERESSLANHNHQNSNNHNHNHQQHHHQQHQRHRQSSKRIHDEQQTQLDDVDVVSDIHDYPPRKLFKAEPITATHQHHHHHHRATRRA